MNRHGLLFFRPSVMVNTWSQPIKPCSPYTVMRFSLLHKKPVGERVVIIGAGGIGYDVAEYLVDGEAPPSSLDVQRFLRDWGVDPDNEARGGIEGVEEDWPEPKREVIVCQRSANRPGGSLGKTTGWIHRATLKKYGVRFLPGVTYLKIDDRGLHVDLGDGPDRQRKGQDGTAGPLSKRSRRNAGVDDHGRE